jgi:hypothetical protein
MSLRVHPVHGCNETVCCVAPQVTFSAAAGTTPPATFGDGGSLQLWYTISELENENPVTIGGDTVALGAVKYEKPFPVSHDAIMCLTTFGRTIKRGVVLAWQRCI